MRFFSTMTFYLAHNRGYGMEVFLERCWSQQLFGCESCVPQHQNLVHHKTVLHYSHSVHKVSHLNSTVAPCRIYNKGYYSTLRQCDTIWSGRYGKPAALICMSEDVAGFYGIFVLTYTTIWHKISHHLDGLKPQLQWSVFPLQPTARIILEFEPFQTQCT